MEEYKVSIPRGLLHYMNDVDDFRVMCFTVRRDERHIFQEGDTCGVHTSFAWWRCRDGHSHTAVTQQSHSSPTFSCSPLWHFSMHQCSVMSEQCSVCSGHTMDCCSGVRWWHSGGNAVVQ